MGNQCCAAGKQDAQTTDVMDMRAQGKIKKPKKPKKLPQNNYDANSPAKDGVDSPSSEQTPDHI